MVGAVILHLALCRKHVFEDIIFEINITSKIHNNMQHTNMSILTFLDFCIFDDILVLKVYLKNGTLRYVFDKVLSAE